MTARRSYLAVLLWLGSVSCSPWTIRPIDDGKASSAGAVTSPAAYVDSIWSAKLLPAIVGSAVDARDLLGSLSRSPAASRAEYAHQQPNSAAYWIVKGRGRVIQVDRHSRVGLLLVAVVSRDDRPDVSIQIGPVVRGTSARDSTGLISFSDFTNQLQYADVGNEINDRILKTVLAPRPGQSTPGSRIAFTGTAPADDGSPPIHDLMPVILAVEEKP
jgi:predicted lipoprotein